MSRALPLPPGISLQKKKKKCVFCGDCNGKRTHTDTDLCWRAPQCQGKVTAALSPAVSLLAMQSSKAYLPVCPSFTGGPLSTPCLHCFCFFSCCGIEKLSYTTIWAVVKCWLALETNLMTKMWTAGFSYEGQMIPLHFFLIWRGLVCIFLFIKKMTTNVNDSWGT